MPDTLNNKRLSEHEHSVFKSALRAARGNSNIREPYAVATSAVKRFRQGKKRKGNAGAALVV